MCKYFRIIGYRVRVYIDFWGFKVLLYVFFRVEIWWRLGNKWSFGLLSVWILGLFFWFFKV